MPTTEQNTKPNSASSSKSCVRIIAEAATYEAMLEAAGKRTGLEYLSPIKLAAEGLPPAPRDRPARIIPGRANYDSMLAAAADRKDVEYHSPFALTKGKRGG